MPPTRSRTERPYAPLLYAVTGFSMVMLSVSGRRFRSPPFGAGGAANETPPLAMGTPNPGPANLKPGGGPWQPVSFTGAVSSKSVTEECDGWLSLVGNQVQ